MIEPREVELKLICAAADLAGLRDWPRLAATGACREDLLESIYFDTPEQLLRKSGYVLRIRRTQSGYVQTVKAAGDGLIERPEWEQSVAGGEPDRDALDATPVGKLLGKRSKLAPLFSVSVERCSCLLRQGRSLIEVALDQGSIRKAEAIGEADTLLMSEIELELKDGSVTDLFAFAREIAALVPVRLGVESKAERGFALIETRSAQAFRAEPVILSDKMTAAEAFRTVAHGCLRHLRINEEVLLERRCMDALHQTRVAVRRLRSAMTLFGSILDDHQFEVLKARLKDLAEPLGRARNLDILLTETLPAERSRHPEDLRLPNLEKHLESQRADAYAAVVQRLRSQEWRQFLLDLVAWVNAGPWLSEGDRASRDEPALRFASRALDKWSRRVRTRGRDLAALSPEDRHKVRIATKKLRYGAEFFASLYSGKKARKQREIFLSALSDLQDRLGVLNDIASSGELLESLTGPDAVEAGLLAARFAAAAKPEKTKKLLKRAERAHERLTESEPFWR